MLGTVINWFAHTGYTHKRTMFGSALIMDMGFNLYLLACTQHRARHGVKRAVYEVRLANLLDSMTCLGNAGITVQDPR